MKWLPVALLALAACSQKTAKDAKSISKSQIDSAMDALNKKFVDTLHPFAAGAHKYGPPTGKIRVADDRDQWHARRPGGSLRRVAPRLGGGAARSHNLATA